MEAEMDCMKLAGRRPMIVGIGGARAIINGQRLFASQGTKSAGEA
jgi:hypothetical protein